MISAINLVNPDLGDLSCARFVSWMVGFCQFASETAKRRKNITTP
ncbi:hypothetical protein [Anabaena sp. CS-542/02]|nr:hypothetical protein [Anabaena sp. CS-542/02]MDB9445345.1 hypothetical protein [Anabaena sp. CS-542/02]